MWLSKNSVIDTGDCAHTTWPALRTSAPPLQIRLCGVVLGLVLLAGCSPRVQVEAPEKPITINLNVKIQHEILVKVDKEIDNLLEENSELF